MSDGIADNLNREEIEKLIAGKTQEEAFMILAKITTERMQNEPTIAAEEPAADQNYSDVFYQRPKQDNRGLVVFDVA